MTEFATSQASRSRQRKFNVNAGSIAKRRSTGALQNASDHPAHAITATSLSAAMLRRSRIGLHF
ncbi:MAG: hypothetical protein DME89_11810 [Verrucomicrobia bacterium]|nr:MAG: hypothetical protein DME89_11810 [Verrucomicrobiota bacterium]